MKKVYFSILLLSVLCFNGCAAPNETPMPKETEPETVAAAESIESSQEAPEKEGIKSESHLELTGFENHAPYYTCHFQKIDSETGEISAFEYKPDPEDSAVITMPKNVEIFPSENLGLLTSSFSGDEKPENEITLSFWNRGKEKTFQIVLDGMKYELSLPEEEAKEATLNQKLTPEGPQAFLDKVIVYSHTVLLELSGIDKDHWDCDFELMNAETQESMKPLIFYEGDLEKLSLLFISGHEIPETGLIFRIIPKTANPETGKTSHDYDINFSEETNTAE